MLIVLIVKFSIDERYFHILFTSVNYGLLMSKTVSARIPNKNHDTLRERCNQLGCTINEYIEHAIEFAMDGSTEFDFDVDEPEIKPESE